MKMKLAVTAIVFILASSFVITRFDDQPFPVPPSKQRTGGDAKKGYEYLVKGNYISSGIPLSVFKFGSQGQADFLRRGGINTGISHGFTAIAASNGEVVVAPNCLQCHAQVFEDQLIIGLGNSLADFTKKEGVNANNIRMLEELLKLNAPKQYEASASFFRASKLVNEQIYVNSKGVNVADGLTGILVAHRDPMTLKWIEKAQMIVPKEIIPTDTPPWWLLKKKNAMFYNGFGRGDFGRFLMASSLLTVSDTAESSRIDAHMPDVLAYIYSLEPPKYQKAIDATLASSGRVIFEQNCSGCHGSYGKEATYPNLLIPGKIVQTDSMLYKSNYSSPQFVNWFNKSWFTSGDHPAKLEPFDGYIAPPLDGIWISAPYLHNGSVPTLEALLNTKERPVFWSRNFDQPEYDYENVGWKYKKENGGGNSSVYNTTLPGYSNVGHYFGDVLTAKERKAVIEYLKTL